MESDDLDSLEEDLYSKIYHDSNSPSLQSVDFVIDSNVRKSAGGMRYYKNQDSVNSKNGGKNKSPMPRFIKPRKFQNLPLHPESRKLGDTGNLAQDQQQQQQETTTSIVKSFVPYSSVLFSSVLQNGSPSVVSTSDVPATLQDIVVADNGPATVIAKNSKSPAELPPPSPKTTSSSSTNASIKDEKIFTSPSKKIMKLSKKVKSNNDFKQNKRVLAQKSKPELIEILSSDEDNSVIYVEPAPTPLIAVESSSDDDDNGVKKQKRTTKKGSGSPSTSSIISDEFIVRSDKSRLKNIFHPKSPSNIPPFSKLLRPPMFDEDTSNDSIYNTKLMAMNRIQNNSLNPASVSSKQRQRSSSDDDDNDIQIVAERQSDGEDSNDSAKLKPDEKRSRFDKPNYNEREFSSLITNAIVKKQGNEKKANPRGKSSSSSKSETIDIEGGETLKNCDLILNVSCQSDSGSQEDSAAVISLFQEFKEPESEDIAKQLDCEVGWNEEMKYFYNEYSYGRDFSITNVRSYMPIGDNWKINNADRNLIRDLNFKKFRCRNCNEVGHKGYQCYRPKKKVICFMCGEIGHTEMRCPNAICLRCGKKTGQFSTACNNCARFGKKKCPLCKNAFHDLDQCPDKWRRYHATTTVNGAEVLDIECTRNNRVYCSICAKQGHFADSCVYFNKQKDAYITSSWFAISNKPSYASNCKFEIKVKVEQVLQLLTYMPVYFFNLKLPSNCHFYPNFRNRFLEEKYGMKTIEEFKESNEQKSQQKETAQKQKQPQPTSASKDIVPVKNVIQAITEAKILVNIDRKRILKAQRGEVETLGAKCNVAITFPEQADDQNHLLVLGTVANQSSFQRELRALFFKCELEKHQEKIEMSTQLPRTVSKIVERIRSDLQQLNCASIKDAKRTLHTFMQSERNLDCKNLIKCRRHLNIVFMGYAELKEGAVHLKELRKILVTLEQQIEEGNGDDKIEQALKEKLLGHLRYIFSPIDHGNYLQLFRSYKKVVQQRSSKKKAKKPLM